LFDILLVLFDKLLALFDILLVLFDILLVLFDILLVLFDILLVKYGYWQSGGGERLYLTQEGCMGIDIKTLTESNREAWNEALAFHRKARGNALHDGFAGLEFTAFDRDCDDVLIAKLSGIDLTGKTIAQLPCNNGRELLSLMRFGAKEAVGFDISDAAVSEARELAEVSGLNARFERVNILEIDEGYNGCFDFIFISEGSLQWFPDLDEYFGVVSRLLKAGGELLIFEIHPVAYLFETDFGPGGSGQGIDGPGGTGPDSAGPDSSGPGGGVSYFEKGPYSYRDGLDYIGGEKYEAKTCY